MAFTVTISELIDVIVMTLALGYIFKDIFTPPTKEHYDPLNALKTQKYSDFKFAMMVTAPAIILHELGHKIAAVSFGLDATFHAAYAWLAIGVLLKILGTGIIFFVPAFVSISGSMTPGIHSLVAFAGPFVNLLLFLGATAYVRYGKPDKTQTYFLVLTKRINIILFIFNMLPIPLFDGFTVYQGIFATFF